MRALISRVLSASVAVDNLTISSIDRGLLVLIGVGNADTADDVKWITTKLVNARLFSSLESGKAWSKNVTHLSLPILLVSQFTLHGSLRKPQPDFHHAAKADSARFLFDSLIVELRKIHGEEMIKIGAFGEMMQVASVNDGPVTLWLDSHNRDNEYYEPDVLPVVVSSNVSLPE